MGGPREIHRVIESVESRVTNDMNKSLLQPCSDEEIKRALKQMHPAKAPRADSMPPLFIKKIWPIVETSFIATCLSILNCECDPSSQSYSYCYYFKNQNPGESQRF